MVAEGREAPFLWEMCSWEDIQAYLEGTTFMNIQVALNVLNGVGVYVVVFDHMMLGKEKVGGQRRNWRGTN